MRALWMKKADDITRRSDRPCGRPFQLQHQHGLIAHASRAAQDRLDGTGECYESRAGPVLFSVAAGNVSSCVQTTSAANAEGAHNADEGSAARHRHTRA